MKDREIVDLFISRSEIAIKETIEQYSHYCSSISFRILGNNEDVEECLSEVWNCAWNSIPPQQPNNLKAYLGKLTRDISISYWRKAHASKRFHSEIDATIDELEELISDDDLDSKYNEIELSKAISDFLRMLPEIERNLFVLRYWYNCSIQELCDRYSFGVSKVKVTLKRTRDKLAKHLKKEGYLL